MKLNEPAMPLLGETNGLSLREYAAIHLCVPMSGNDELDAMIKRAQRERLAATALNGIVQSELRKGGFGCETTIGRMAWDYADAVIAAGESNEAK